MKKKRVLMFEDSSIHLECMVHVLGDDADVIAVTGLTKNLARYMGRGPFDLIIMDGHLSGQWEEELETESYVRQIRSSGYTGPIIANSASKQSNEALMLAGCDYENGSEKYQTPWKVAQLLGLKRKMPNGV